MGKIPPLAICGIALVLVIGISLGAQCKMVQPAQAQLDELQAQLATEQAKADELATTEQRLADVQIQWDAAQAQLAKLRKERGIQCSFAHPLPALFASLWPELRINLPRVIEEWIEEQGVVITSGASLAAPPSTPPKPTGDFMQVGNITLQIQGSLTDIERFYRALPTFPRVATIGGLSLAGEGDRITAAVPMTIYLLVELPPEAAAAVAVEARDETMEPGMEPSGEPGLELEEEEL